MSSTHNDDDLRQLFREQTAADMRNAPAFHPASSTTMGAQTAWRPAWLVASAAAACLLLGTLWYSNFNNSAPVTNTPVATTTPGPNTPEESENAAIAKEYAVGEFSYPTDTLLNLPGSEWLASMPQFGYSTTDLSNLSWETDTPK